MSDLTYWTKSFEVSTFLVNSQGHLGLYQLLNILQDVAWAHSVELGVGTEAISKQNMLWVLARQKVVMEYWPKWGESIDIKTWVRPGDGPYALREFSILLGEKEIGVSTTTWITLDMITRRPVKFDEHSVFDLYQADRKLEISAQKVSVLRDANKLATFSVRNSDIDFNQHVNNTRYAQWILDSIPMEKHKQKLLEYDINFLAETKLGDAICIEYQKENLNETNPYPVYFQGKRDSDLKVVFTAKFLTLS